MRPSTLLFATAGGLVVAQFLPFIGLISMVGAAYLVGLLLDLALLLLIVEGVVGAAPRWQALTAAALLGGYVATAALSKRQASAFNDALRANNAGLVVQWSPSSHDLLLISHRDDTMRASRLTGDALIAGFNVGRVYRRVDGSPDPTKMITAKKGSCAVAETVAERFRRVTRDGWCYRTDDGVPSRATVRIETGPIHVRRAGLIREVRQAIVIRAPDASVIELHAGYAEALPWMPWPVIGMEWSGGGSYNARPIARLAFEGRAAWRRREDQLTIVTAALRLSLRAPGKGG